MAGEGGARLLQLLDQFSVLAFERDSVGLESGPCAISQERVVGGPFAPRADRHVGLPNHIGMPLEAPEGSAPVEMHGNRVKFIPPLQPAMGFYCAFDQGIHCRLSMDNRFSHEKMRARIGLIV
jgi:hypothetical protein